MIIETFPSFFHISSFMIVNEVFWDLDCWSWRDDNFFHNLKKLILNNRENNGQINRLLAITSCIGQIFLWIIVQRQNNLTFQNKSPNKNLFCGPSNLSGDLLEGSRAPAEYWIRLSAGPTIVNYTYSHDFLQHCRDITKYFEHSNISRALIWRRPFELCGLVRSILDLFLTHRIIIKLE